MSELIKREDAINAVEMFFEDAYIEDAEVHDLVYKINHIPAAQRWVRCEEEMPKEMKVVVTYGKGRVSFGYCMFLYDADMEKNVCEWVDTHSNRMEVTHWMPLPEPPKEEN